MTYKTDMERQAAKYRPDGDGELALKVFRKIWPECYADGTLTWKMPDRTLTYDGRTFVLRIKITKRSRGRDDKGLKHELKRSLEVFNMVLTLRLPVYACPDFRMRVRRAQDELGPKLIRALAKLQDLAESLPEAKHSAKWGYGNALIDPVNNVVKKEGK